jgi:hypothetical protein
MVDQASILPLHQSSIYPIMRIYLDSVTDVTDHDFITVKETRLKVGVP